MATLSKVDWWRRYLLLPIPLMVLGLCASGFAQALPPPPSEPVRVALEQLLRGFDGLDRQLDGASRQEVGVHLVRPGETLDGIIDRSAWAELPVRRSILRQAFVAANPHAFRRGSPDFLFAGAELRSPGPEHLRGVVFSDHLPVIEPAQDMRTRSRGHWIRYP